LNASGQNGIGLETAVVWAPGLSRQRGHGIKSVTCWCTLPEILDDVQAGEHVWFDDGTIGGVIEKVRAEQIFVRTTQASSEGEKLRSDKRINLLDSALTHADMARSLLPN